MAFWRPEIVALVLLWSLDVSTGQTCTGASKWSRDCAEFVRSVPNEQCETQIAESAILTKDADFLKDELVRTEKEMTKLRKRLVDSEPDEQFTRILFLKEDKSNVQYTHRTKEIKDYDDETITDGVGIAYDKKLRNIVWAVGDTPNNEPRRGIYAKRIDGDTINLVIPDVASRIIAADNGLVFIGGDSMSVFNPATNKLTVMEKYNNLPPSIDIALDTRAKKVFTCHGESLVQMDYDGKNMKTLATSSNKGIKGIALDPNCRMLYYQDGDKLFKLMPYTEWGPKLIKEGIFSADEWVLPVFTEDLLHFETGKLFNEWDPWEEVIRGKNYITSSKIMGRCLIP